MHILTTGTEIELPRITFIKDEKNGVIEAIKRKINVPFYVVKIDENDSNYNTIKEIIQNNLVTDILNKEAERSLKNKYRYSDDIELLFMYIKEVGWVQKVSKAQKHINKHLDRYEVLTNQIFGLLVGYLITRFISIPFANSMDKDLLAIGVTVIFFSLSTWRMLGFRKLFRYLEKRYNYENKE